MQPPPSAKSAKLGPAVPNGLKVSHPAQNQVAVAVQRDTMDNHLPQAIQLGVNGGTGASRGLWVSPEWAGHGLQAIGRGTSDRGKLGGGELTLQTCRLRPDFREPPTLLARAGISLPRSHSISEATWFSHASCRPGVNARSRRTKGHQALDTTGRVPVLTLPFASWVVLGSSDP